ncbi:MAG: hypothetical protein KBT03_00090 [Bacteroidales bacterium]|nr:hypothetical protein [Candidatus Scybalousia scybalohippi]
MSSEDLNMDEYLDYITGDDYRKEQIKKLTENHRALKSLQYENMGILKSFADTENNEKLLSVVNKVWSGVLGSDTEVNSVDDIVNKSLESDETIKFLNDHRNKSYFPSGKVFEEHLKHPVQKQLTKKKYLSKREAKKQKTPMQTINYVYNAKNSSDKDDRMLKIEKSLEEAHYMISLLAVNQTELGVQVDQSNVVLKEVQDRLCFVEKHIKDGRKLKLYALYTSAKKLTTKQMSEELGVSLRTTKYWLKEMREQGLIDQEI